MTQEQRQEFKKILTEDMKPVWRNVYAESRVLRAMKDAHNAAVRKCADEPNLASVGQLTAKEIILKNLIE